MEDINEEIDIKEFREYVDSLKSYEDEQLNIVIKVCINALWIMYEQGYDMPKKALIELKTHI